MPTKSASLEVSNFETCYNYSQQETAGCRGWQVERGNVNYRSRLSIGICPQEYLQTVREGVGLYPEINLHASRRVLPVVIKIFHIQHWRTQEFYFCRGGGGVSTNSVEDRGQRERGSGGGSPLVRGRGGSCNLVQEISFHIVKFSQFLVL